MTIESSSIPHADEPKIIVNDDLSTGFGWRSELISFHEGYSP